MLWQKVADTHMPAAHVLRGLACQSFRPLTYVNFALAIKSGSQQMPHQAQHVACQEALGAVACVQLAQGRLLSVHLLMQADAPRTLLHEPAAQLRRAEPQARQLPDIASCILRWLWTCLEMLQVCFHTRAEVPRRLPRWTEDPAMQPGARETSCTAAFVPQPQCMYLEHHAMSSNMLL